MTKVKRFISAAADSPDFISASCWSASSRSYVCARLSAATLAGPATFLSDGAAAPGGGGLPLRRKRKKPTSIPHADPPPPFAGELPRARLTRKPLRAQPSASYV